MLRKEFSSSGKWETLSTLNTRVSADFVSMDSSLPLKRRDAIRKASGEIAKSGMELWLNEAQVTELLTLSQLAFVQESDIVAKLFTDTPRVITGVYELMERVFLQGFSAGVAEVSDLDNAGANIRLDYGYLTANKFGVSVLWDENPTTAKPLDDLRRVIKKAKDQDGNTLTDVWMDDVAFERMTATDNVKNFFAWSINYLGAAQNVPSPTLEQLNAALKRDQRYGCTIHIIDRTIITEKDGARKSEKPWQPGMVVFSTGTQVGVLSWAQLAEMIQPAAGVSYQRADEYILVSMFSVNRPSFSEYTTSQARAVPVICDVDHIYQLDTKVIQA
ncbi:MAG: major capsid protein [Candidatus Azobacteroides sp.]|nr:major capsid protein [Candidatus Azobacteroides sp.]